MRQIVPAVQLSPDNFRHNAAESNDQVDHSEVHEHHNRQKKAEKQNHVSVPIALRSTKGTSTNTISGGFLCPNCPTFYEKELSKNGVKSTYRLHACSEIQELFSNEEPSQIYRD